MPARLDGALLDRARAHLAAFERLALPDDGRRRAAVAEVLLPDEDGRPCFLITRRAATLRQHTGQWALPGGRVDAGETAERAALRELQEEVELVPNPAEVAKIFRVPLDDLEGPDVPRLISIPESDRPVIQLPLLGTLIHAPTAAVLYQMREVVVHGRPTRVNHFEQPVWAWR